MGYDTVKTFSGSHGTYSYCPTFYCPSQQNPPKGLHTLSASSIALSVLSWAHTSLFVPLAETSCHSRQWLPHCWIQWSVLRHHHIGKMSSSGYGSPLLPSWNAFFSWLPVKRKAKQSKAKQSKGRQRKGKERLVVFLLTHLMLHDKLSPNLEA